MFGFSFLFRRRRCKNRILSAFPVEMHSDVKVVLRLIPMNEGSLLHESERTVVLDGTFVVIPNRVYFKEVAESEISRLSKNQKIVLSCIYLSHYDGYVREKYLRRLVGSNQSWVVPFKIHLLGEYVYEILKVLSDQITEDDLSCYAFFIRENPIYWRTIKSRMISYWNEYYRGICPVLKQYVGVGLVHKIDNFA